jgi:phosphatidylglycerol:prolipoprotein diacylglycerol transferase
MLMYPHIDPIAVQIGPLAVHWYGLTYLAAFVLFWLLAQLRLKHEPYCSIADAGAWTRRDVEDMLFLGIVGAVLGGRLGYCLFYKPEFYLAHPLQILAVWQGGMSFHGGLLGAIGAGVFFARSRGKPFWQVMDFAAPGVPVGLGCGRIGNFINGELWGRLADPSLPWAMVFPQSGTNAPRHPSQLYQALLEGVLLFILLWLYARKPRRAGQVSGAFLIGYGAQRFVVEYFREPDDFLGLLSLGLSMGQWLCMPMILLGIALWAWATYRRPIDT